VNEQCAEFLVVMREWPVPQPVAEFVSVARFDQFFERAETVAKAYGACVEGKQVQIMITEYGNDGVTQFSHKTQCFQGLWSTIDEITG